MIARAPRFAAAATLVALAALAMPALGDTAEAQRRRARSIPAAQQQASRAETTGVYYRGCHEARRAGVAPLYRGQPGYRPQMDGDNDGIACEPYRGRR